MTTIVIGKIKNIVDEKDANGYDKKTLCLTGNSGTVFIDFRGVERLLLEDFKQNDLVAVSFKFNGKTSKIGKTYNNLIGTSIKKI